MFPRTILERLAQNGASFNKDVDAAVFTRIREVIANMEYAFSSINDDHKTAKTDSDIWDYFYMPIKHWYKDRSGVLVGIRRIQESNDGNNHQVYSYKKIKQSHPRSATNISNNVGDTNKEYTTATDIVASNEPIFNTTGSIIRESRT